MNWFSAFGSKARFLLVFDIEPVRMDQQGSLTRLATEAITAESNETRRGKNGEPQPLAEIL
jgi:hypothetical protein